eukprot:6182970-Pleurochrysis_carterae.AAC.2
MASNLSNQTRASAVTVEDVAVLRPAHQHQQAHSRVSPLRTTSNDLKRSTIYSSKKHNSNRVLGGHMPGLVTSRGRVG